MVSVQCMFAMHARSRCLITSCRLFALDLPPESVEYGVATAPLTVAEVTNIIMKTTGECLSAETIEAGPVPMFIALFCLIDVHMDEKPIGLFLPILCTVPGICHNLLPM